MAEPRRTLLRRLLEKPGARERLGPAVAGLLGACLVALAAIGALTIWHLVRRGRLIRERLAPPRVVRLPELGAVDDEDAGKGKPADTEPRRSELQ